MAQLGVLRLELPCLRLPVRRTANLAVHLHRLLRLYGLRRPGPAKVDCLLEGRAAFSGPLP